MNNFLIIACPEYIFIDKNNSENIALIVFFTVDIIALITKVLKVTTGANKTDKFWKRFSMHEQTNVKKNIDQTNKKVIKKTESVWQLGFSKIKWGIPTTSLNRVKMSNSCHKVYVMLRKNNS